MIKFLKLSFTIINLSYVKHIDIKTDKYDIYLGDNNFVGSYNFIKIGELYSKGSKIEVSKMKYPYDYEKITNWMSDLDNENTC